MTELVCAWVRDRLPEFTRDALDVADTARVEQHLSECADCRAEAGLVALLAVPATVPPDLENRVLDAVRVAPVAGASLRHYAVAASVAFVAIMGSILWQQSGNSPQAPAEDDMTVLAWPDDPLLHQTAGLHSLSEDELAVLLEELES